MEPSPLIPGASERVEWTRVVVLAPHAGGDAQSADGAACVIERLQPEFEKRDWFAIVHADPYLAFTELALRERAQTARAAWGLQRMEGLALLIVEPEQWPSTLLDDLRLALRRSLATAAVWIASDDRIEPAEAPPTVTPAPERPTSSSLRLGVHQPSELNPPLARTFASTAGANGSAEPECETPATDRATGLPDAGRLTLEEVDMLLRESELDNENPGRREAGS